MNKIAPSLRKLVNWNKFFSVVDVTGDSLNERKNRFEKSDLFEQALDVCSDGQMKWVDEVGHDHIYNMVKIEMKSQQHCLYTKTGNLKKKVGSIKLMNSLGDASGRTFDDVVRFDHLLIVDTGDDGSYSAAMIHRDDIDPSCLCYEKDGVTLKGVPIKKVSFIIRPEDVGLIDYPGVESYGDAKRNYQREYLERF